MEVIFAVIFKVKDKLKVSLFWNKCRRCF